MDYIDELAIKGREGDGKAIEMLVEKLKPMIVATAYRFNRYDVDDMVQEGYIVLLQCIKDYDCDRGAFLAYFKTKLKYHILNLLRKVKDTLPIMEELVADEGGGPEINFLEKMEHLELEKALRCLGEKQRDIVIRYYIKEQSLSEIARSQGKHYMSAVRLKERALKKLRELMD
ncbi:RNA polymerase sporulation-specific sigma factor [Caldanaerobius fijiensis DSM 17918]|uniref:RNA polymerase sporulation-specific sigma factor n=1 Tax=Caldanaerobius fijiensis DSM 17918 TaxID=1121256 RepID=A0A1M5D6D0_9THEO|nr:sigma-70 family RNA polymerase sigma factor [Caldanaerobius fijiensis]SHF62417.1 RNA polymerase sporulation-specific sigma factor [Caldanaerobius fijiensis DSM 17918]